MGDPDKTERYLAIGRGMAITVGLGLVAHGAAVALNVPREVRPYLVLGLMFLVGAQAGMARARQVDATPWWQSLLTLRGVVASIIALGALAITWWSWAWLAAEAANEVMNTMVALVTAVLGYLFGRGEAENAQRTADLTAQQAKQVAERVDTADEAVEAGKQAVKVLEALAERAGTDPALARYLHDVMKPMQLETPDARRDAANDGG